MSYSVTQKATWSDITSISIADANAHNGDSISSQDGERTTLAVTATAGGVAHTPGTLTILLQGSEDDTNWVTISTATITHAESGTTKDLHTYEVHLRLRVVLTAASGDAANLWTVTGEFTTLYLAGLHESDGYDVIRNPFEFPFAGTMRTVSIVPKMNPAGEVLADITGEGIIREIFIAAGGGVPGDFWTTGSIGILVDGANIETGGTMELGTLCGMIGPQFTDGYGPMWDSEFWDVSCQHGSGQYGVRFRLPIPFDTSCVITLTDGAAAWAVPAAFAYVTYQDVLPNCWNRNYRLKNNISAAPTVMPVLDAGTGTITAVGTAVTFTDAQDAATLAIGDSIRDDGSGECREVVLKPNTTHCTVDRAWTADPAAAAFHISKFHEIVNVAAGKTGAIAALMTSMTPTTADATYMESNIHYHINGAAGRTWESSGFEDEFGNAFYMKGVQRGRHAGVAEWDPVTCYTSTYRDYSRTPILFTDGIKGHWNNEEAAATPEVSMRTACWWYEEV